MDECVTVIFLILICDNVYFLAKFGLIYRQNSIFIFNVFSVCTDLRVRILIYTRMHVYMDDCVHCAHISYANSTLIIYT